MPVIKLSEINEGTRSREVYSREDHDDMAALKASILKFGILVPLIVRKSDMTLIDGGRRFRAATELKLETVPIVFREDATELELREIELESNVQRLDLQWWERDKMIANIHKLESEIHGEKARGTRPDAPGWTIEKTAEMTKEDEKTVRNALEMAEMIEVFPELAQCKTRAEAKKKADRIMEDMIVAEMVRRQKEKAAEEAGLSGLSDGERIVEVARRDYMVGDALEGLRKLPDRSLGFMEVDPPYGIELHDNQRDSTTGDEVLLHYEEVPPEKYPDFLTRLATEVYRVMGEGFVIWWYGQEWYHTVFDTLIKVGFDVDIIPATWVKDRGQTNNPEVTLARATEVFFIARKGAPVMFKRGRLNAFSYGSPVKRYHGTQKPVELLEELLSIFCPPGIRFCCPFLGSGVTIRAALRTGRTAFGWELTSSFKKRFIYTIMSDWLEETDGDTTTS